MKNKINFEKKFEDLKNLNSDFMCKRISMATFVDKQYEIDQTILDDAERIAKKNGKQIRTK